MKKGEKPPPGVRKADALKSAQRVDELVRIRLDGAEAWDVAEYYAEKSKEADSPWFVPENGKPLAERQLRVYVRKADKIIMASSKERRRKAIYRHLAQRRNLYAKATNAGDLRTALAVLDSEAKLRGLYPTAKPDPSGPDADASKTRADEDIADDERLRALAERIRQRRAGAADAGGVEGIRPIDRPETPPDLGTAAGPAGAGVP